MSDRAAGVTDAGYTLTETLAAMAVLGLAMGGLSLGLQVWAGQQAGLGRVMRTSQDARAAETWLERRLAEAGPFRVHEPSRLQGTAQGFRFDCGAAEDCGAQIIEDARGRHLALLRGEGEPVVLELPTKAAARFEYRGNQDVLNVWPPEGAGRQALRSLSLLQGEGPGERVVFETRIRVEQPLDCQFDAVLQDCR